MNQIEIIAQIFGVMGSISIVLSNWQKSKNKMMIFVLLDSVFYFIQYMLLKAPAGAVTNIVSFFRVILFSKKEKIKMKNNNIILYMVLIVYLILGMLTFKTFIDCLPIIATIIYTIFLWQDNTQKIRIGSSIMFFMWMIYDIFVKAYFGAIAECFLLITSLLAIIKTKIEYKKNFIRI